MSEAIKDKFRSLRMCTSSGRRAPHKPLLIVWCLGQLMLKKRNRFVYSESEASLKSLFLSCGVNPSIHNPFWRLRNDKIWHVENSETFRVSRSGDPLITDLRSNGVGMFSEELAGELVKDSALLVRIVQDLLEAHFPESMHRNILRTVGIDPGTATKRKKRLKSRDPKFATLIQEAYGHTCGVCAYKMILLGRPVGLEAAHIKWHAAGGPDSVNNGILLCCLHHQLFDLGVYSFDENYHMVLSERADHTTTGFRTNLEPFEGKKLHLPRISKMHPDRGYLQWHRQEVFIRNLN